ncbi:hypothetical protein [Streptococcus himalayensis]|uniref:Uncharacterized protein n=1 Tax=Streptococcus himalayensis TaxID=1888195 RepID=A0A917A858_9STRE|nr:hypothetical protein [Streptococcus himalayensis]GGE34915.1 hypothetical protein GCM10011510_15350 [Streptococcus himalayensis]
MAGDGLTNLNEKDFRTDQDTLILFQHPKYKNLPLHQRIIKYYSENVLSKDRNKLYEEALSAHPSASPEHQLLYPLATLGGILIGLLLGLKNRKKESRPKGKKILPKTSAVKETPKKVAPQTNAPKTNQTVKKSNPKISIRLNNKVRQSTKQIIRNISKTVQNRVIQPAKQATRNIAKTIHNRVVQPARKAIRNIAQPSRNIANPVVNTVRCITKTVNDTVKNVAKAAANTLKNLFKSKKKGKR